MLNQKTLTYLLIIGCFTIWFGSKSSSAAASRELYFDAEACYQKLRDKPQKQKYRYNWVRCIEKFQEVYRQEPAGPWAAAGLYMSGTLYYELYKRSGKRSDKEEAIDHFNRIVKRFPNSGYYDRAKKAIRTASQDSKQPNAKNQTRRKATADKSTSARDTFYRAEACYKALQDNPGRQKYRDKWLPCIERFETAYRADPSGAWAAASLYNAGYLYYELYRRSYKDNDKKKALGHFKRIVQHYPKSGYHGKASRAIEAIEQDDSLLAAIQRNKENSRSTSDRVDSRSDADKPNGSVTKQGEKSTQSAPGRLSTVTGMRFWSNPNYTRLVIDLDRETSFTSNLLKKDPSKKMPQRLYVDLQNTRLGENIQRIIPIDDDLLEDARAGQYTLTSVRVVADIKSIKTYEVFSLKDPFRIVMDIKGGDRAEIKTQPPKSKPKITGIDPKRSTKNLAKQLSLGVRRIVIDPGHGGKDYGAPGYIKGVHEKDVVLQISKRLARKLRKKLKCEVILTRGSDRFLTLEERTAFANTKNADLFISIHTNANKDSRAYGLSTYFLNPASDDDAIRVAAMENATSTKNISDLQTILFSLMHYAKVDESSRLAAYIQNSMQQHLKKKGYSRIKNKGVKKAPFYVLLGAQMPSVLIETSFISNPRECRRLTNPKYQERLSEGIVKGVQKYIKDTKPTAFQYRRRQAGKSG
jgi:N-acetylmuramoyl-L-alanine amidase